MIKVEQKKTVEIKMTDEDKAKLAKLAKLVDAQEDRYNYPTDRWVYETLLNDVANDVLIDNVIYDNIFKNSKSNYTLEKTEIQRGIVEFLITKLSDGEYKKTTVKHDRGNMPHSYKYRPTSQTVEICLQKELKHSIRINIFQAKS